MERIIHQIWVGPYPMPARERGYIERIRAMHSNFEHRLWTDDNLPELPRNIRFQFDNRAKTQDYAFQADVLRPLVVALHGGVYLDVDYEPMEGFTGIDFDAIDGLFYHHSIVDITIPNATLGLAKGHPLAQHLLDSIHDDKYDYGPHWLGAEVRRFLGLHVDDTHRVVGPALKKQRIAYLPEMIHQDEPSGASGGRAYYDLFRHNALYSWSKENKERFARGEMV